MSDASGESSAGGRLWIFMLSAAVGVVAYFFSDSSQSHTDGGLNALIPFINLFFALSAFVLTMVVGFVVRLVIRSDP